MKKICLIILVISLTGCGATKQAYLIKNPERKPSRYIQWECLNLALNEVSSGAPLLTELEKKPLQGVKTGYFLWWGSLSGPKPVVNSKGQVTEARSLLRVINSYRQNVSERYVLCLLDNGYMWPSENLGIENKN
jgi:hypothetical protein